MSIHPQAGKLPKANQLLNIEELLSAYTTLKLDLAPVSFGTSGHRGSSLKSSFNETHILAITQAICEYRKSQDINGPLYIGIDTHALSKPALLSCLQVLAANDVEALYQEDFGVTPTPVISHAILTWNQKNDSLADGIVITPSHNPPEDGGFKYNSIDGGPANTDITTWVENRANEIIAGALLDVNKISQEQALSSANIKAYDYIPNYVNDLENVIDMQAIKDAKIKIAADPLGGASLPYWQPIIDKYGLDITVVNKSVDPTFKFMSCDRDGKIRMDCSSPWAMSSLIKLKDQYDIAFGNDPDSDRHGIVTRSSGLLNPNHYLSVAILYLYQNRSQWDPQLEIGKTLVSSSMIDKVGTELKRTVCEVPVGFKWFVDGLVNHKIAFGGEESAGASFLRKDGSVWTTDKDGIILCLLAAEILAVSKKDPGELYTELTKKHGSPIYARIDAAASPEQKNKLKQLSPEDIKADSLAGYPILEKLSHANGNGAAIGGLKVTTEAGWFAARPSGTEDIYKIYAESFISEDHLKELQQDAQNIVDNAIS
ncbi:phosphoglucomutase (alpha-D-glucose-1,6-bisphosphate-dependent) [Lentisphaera profundi]|uniref:Phosphoglucomutase (Alpha-D-glucose-1,6-bisphosphate-dependent) n=1 Tax=Lentisphaera profundi TaxID=1658616 RepID=A0ABY7VVK5_9BACT|nr:phosphoglucomutase (alpha-D-glucose-1,6-bisphosphate-dependent) [Lentisphaera profundi]WDE98102.1 phosphoglucomutase (alpha-D-glucose-1,6-bisphosphate-dependent) [Lentisphaera profundi]